MDRVRLPRRREIYDIEMEVTETITIIILIKFFFFSSRRRHTRWTGDWSSDVCSSDLRRTESRGAVLACKYCAAAFGATTGIQDAGVPLLDEYHGHRSEERRVGKECRQRRS